MNKILLLATFVGICSSGLAQTDFVKQLKEIGSGNKMTKEFAVEYFGASAEHYDTYYCYKMSSILRICRDSIQLIYTSNSLVRSESFLSVFSIDGTKEHASFTIDEGGDHDGSIAVSSSTSYDFLEDQIIQITQLAEVVKDKSKIQPGTDWLIEGESFWDLETETTYEYKYLKINDCSVSPLTTKNEVNPERDFEIASKKLLTAKDFKSLTKEELRLMRNEIFAAYGYIFKSKDLSEYFRNQSWYSPEIDDVTAQLSDIEKLNAQRIIEYEKKATNKRW